MKRKSLYFGYLFLIILSNSSLILAQEGEVTSIWNNPEVFTNRITITPNFQEVPIEQRSIFDFDFESIVFQGLEPLTIQEIDQFTASLQARATFSRTIRFTTTLTVADSQEANIASKAVNYLSYCPTGDFRDCNNFAGRYQEIQIGLTKTTGFNGRIPLTTEVLQLTNGIKEGQFTVKEIDGDISIVELSNIQEILGDIHELKAIKTITLDDPPQREEILQAITDNNLGVEAGDDFQTIENKQQAIDIDRQEIIWNLLLDLNVEKRVIQDEITVRWQSVAGQPDFTEPPDLPPIIPPPIIPKSAIEPLPLAFGPVDQSSFTRLREIQIENVGIECNLDVTVILTAIVEREPEFSELNTIQQAQMIWTKIMENNLPLEPEEREFSLTFLAILGIGLASIGAFIFFRRRQEPIESE